MGIKCYKKLFLVLSCKGTYFWGKYQIKYIIGKKDPLTNGKIIEYRSPFLRGENRYPEMGIPLRFYYILHSSPFWERVLDG